MFCVFQAVKRKEQEDKHKQMMEARKQYKEKTLSLLQFQEKEEQPKRKGGGKVIANQKS